MQKHEFIFLLTWYRYELSIKGDCALNPRMATNLRLRKMVNYKTAGGIQKYFKRKTESVESHHLRLERKEH